MPVAQLKLGTITSVPADKNIYICVCVCGGVCVCVYIILRRTIEEKKWQQTRSSSYIYIYIYIAEIHDIYFFCFLTVTLVLYEMMVIKMIFQLSALT